MARLHTIDPKTSTGRAKELFDGPLAGKHFNLFKAMANSGSVLDAYVSASGALSKGTLTGAEREAVQLVVAEANTCGYCAAAHTALGKMAGLSEAQTVEARRGRMSDAKLGALTRFTLALHEKRGHVSDEDLSAFRAAGYTDGHVAEVVAGYALAVFTNYLNHVNQTAVDFPAIAKI